MDLRLKILQLKQTLGILDQEVDAKTQVDDNNSDSVSDTYSAAKIEERLAEVISLPDGVYTLGLGVTTDGKITISNGVITAIQEAT